MTILFWILGIIAFIYLLLVIPAGIVVLLKEMKYKKSPDRPSIDNIIREYKDSLAKQNKVQLDNLVEKTQREIVEKNGQKYSVEYSASRHKNRYNVIISVGKFGLVTIGHAEKFSINIPH